MRALAWLIVLWMILGMPVAVLFMAIFWNHWLALAIFPYYAALILLLSKTNKSGPGGLKPDKVRTAEQITVVLKPAVKQSPNSSPKLY